MNAGTSLYRIQRFTPFRHDSATGAYACPMLIHGDQAMKRPLQYLIIGAALLIGSSGDVLAHCGRSHNVIAPHNGFSFGYGGLTSIDIVATTGRDNTVMGMAIASRTTITTAVSSTTTSVITTGIVIIGRVGPPITSAITTKRRLLDT